MPLTPHSEITTSCPWDPDTLDADLLRIAWRTLADFVAWLQQGDIAVPRCWYVHGWVVHCLLAVQHWHTDAYTAPATARQAAEWWALGLRPLTQDWADLQGHRDAHPPADRPWAAPVVVPTLDEFIEHAVDQRRERAA